MIIFSSIYAYSTTSTSEAAYVIGGGDTPGIIAEFKGYTWRQFGTLTKGRGWHGSISKGYEIMVIGGDSSNGR